MKNSCYIINFYFGNRRKTIDTYNSGDRLFFYRKQIEVLEKYSHNLSKIIFTCNIEKEDYKYISELFKITPKYIQGAEVELHIRENYGMSYGAWSDAFDRNEDEYEYFIFNEDDYFFIQNNWDSYLIEKFNSYTDSGFVCMAAIEPHHWNNYKKHCGHSTSISSNQVLKDIKSKFGCIPHTSKKDYHNNQIEGQIEFSFSAVKLGYNIYDVRDDYKTPFAWTGEDDKDIWRLWEWNEKILCMPAILIEKTNYNWFENWDGEFIQNYIPTSNKEALECYYDKKSYYGEKL